jgi:hypothetical protein
VLLERAPENTAPDDVATCDDYARMTRMRRVIAALILAVVASLHIADPLVCPDGCTDDSRPTQSAPLSTHAVPGACLLCQSGLLAAPDIPSPTVALVVSGIVSQPDIDIALPTIRRIEHPPRLS